MSRSRKSKKCKKKKVVVASRTNSRVPRDGIPIAEKAAKRTIARDNISGMNSQNPFTVLNNTPDALLRDIISDLDIEVENVEVQLDVFKQEELEAANYKKYLEAQYAKNSPANDEELKDLTMEVISNQHRDCLELFPMERGGIDNSESCEGLLSTFALNLKPFSRMLGVWVLHIGGNSFLIIYSRRI